MISSSGFIKKLEPVIATGMPGAYKVLIFFLIQHIYSIEILGNIASWQSIAQIIGYFTAIGWASLILVRVAKAETIKDRVEAFNRLCMMSAVTLAFCCCVIIVSGLLIGKLNESIQVAYWTIAWTFYQIPRHYFTALRAYRRAIALDVAILMLSTISILTAPAEAASIFLTLSMLASGLTALILIQRNSKAKKIYWNYETKGLEFGLVNFLGGGVSLSLIPLAAMLESDAFVGILSLFVSTMGIALLIPRAISIHQLPKISKLIDTPSILAIHITRMRQQITLSNILTSAICLTIGAAIILRSADAIHPFEIATTFFLIIIQNTVSTQGLIDANILICKEKSKNLLRVNIITSSAFLITVTIITWKPISHAFIYICLTTALLNIYRLNRTKHYANLAHDSHTAL